jgi:hypothetical protein
MNVTLHSLFLRVFWSDVARALRRCYPSDARELQPYLAAFHNMRRMVPEDCPSVLVIEPEPLDPEDLDPEDDGPPGERAHVSCRDGSLNEHTGQEARLGLDLTPWPRCLGMKVTPATRQAYTDAEVVAHCLWELTWYGFDETAPLELAQELGVRLDEMSKGKFLTIEELEASLGLTAATELSPEPENGAPAAPDPAGDSE